MHLTWLEITLFVKEPLSSQSGNLDCLVVVLCLGQIEAFASRPSPGNPVGCLTVFKIIVQISTYPSLPVNAIENLRHQVHFRLLNARMEGKCKKLPYFTLLCGSFQMLSKLRLETGCNGKHSFYSIIL